MSKVQRFIPKPANQNTRHEDYDHMEWLCKVLGYDFVGQGYKKIATGVVCASTERSQKNFYWYLKYEYAFRQGDAVRRRTEMRES